MTALNANTSVHRAESLSAWRLTFAWVIGASVVRALLSSLVPMVPDETYYWLWTRHLAPGYFDHPPGIALLIAASTSVIGVTPAGS